MASNFRIDRDQRGDGLHLELTGDFDGTSAYELINTLQTYGHGTGSILIDTSNLSCIHPFGIAVFQKNSTARRMSRRITFTGEYGTEMALGTGRWV